MTLLTSCVVCGLMVLVLVVESARVTRVAEAVAAVNLTRNMVVVNA